MLSKTFRRLMLVAVVVGGSLGVANAANAGGFAISVGHNSGYHQSHNYGHSHTNFYAPSYDVVSYQTIQVPYTKYVTEYDCYGCPVLVLKTFYTVQQVPVRY